MSLIDLLIKLRFIRSLRKLFSLSCFLLSEPFLIIIIFEIIVESGCRSEALEDSNHSLASFWVDFLAVSSLTSWLVLV